MPKLSSRIFKAEKIQTVLAGFLLILNGDSVLENFPKIALLLIILGVLLLLYVSLVSLKIPQDPIIKPLVLFLEGIGFFGTSYILFKLGKNYLPYGYLLAAFICLFGVFWSYRKINQNSPIEKIK